MNQPPQTMRAYDVLSADDSPYIEVNGYMLDRSEWPGSDGWVIESFLHKKTCPYCNTRMLKSKARKSHGEGDVSDLLLLFCKNCAFWQLMHKYLNMTRRISGIDWGIYTSKAREFETDLPDGVASELAVALRRDSNRWSAIEPKAFERFVADVFRANYKHSEVMHVGKRGDRGIDVLLVDTNKKTWLVQVKARTNERPERVETIRNLLGVMLLHQNPYGIVVSTADYFTHQCTVEAKIAAQVGYELQLVDRGRLNCMLDSVLPTKPWFEALDEVRSDDLERSLEAMEARLMSMLAAHNDA